MKCPIWGEKKMVEQGYNYLDGPMQSMAEFFEVRIENLEKSIPLSAPPRKKENEKSQEKESSYV